MDFGILFEISKYKCSFSLDLLDVRHNLHDMPILRLMEPIKMRFWAHKTHKNALK
jgi:hypothetical protein